MERNRGVWVATTAIVTLLASLLGGILAYIGPRTYESVCVIELLPSSPEVARLNEGETLADQVRTAAAVMVSQSICSRASDALDLTLRWGLDQETVVQVLKAVVSAEVIPGTTLIEIRVRCSDAADSRDVAMEMAKTFRARLAEIESDQLESQFTHLERFDLDLDSEKEQLEKRFDVDAADGVIRAKIADIEARKAMVAGERERLELRLRVPVQRVVFHEEPTLARVPVAPNVPVSLGAWSLGGLVAGLLLGWWLSGLVWPVAGLPRREPGPDLRRADAW